MIINGGNLAILNTGYKVLYAKAFAGVVALYLQVATLVPSTTSLERYGWLGSIPRLREWIGERVVSNIGAFDYSIINKTFEATISVPREAIEDDTYGVYGPLFSELGNSAARHPDELTFALLAAGFVTLCYDGRPFFATDHPVGNQLVSNMQDGVGAPWFLLDVSRAIKPLIFQKRRDYALQARDSEKDENVFWRKEYIYGVDARVNVGYGFWQMAHGSKAPLDEGSYEAARQAMGALTDDSGKPLGINGGLLVCGPSNEGRAKRIIEASALANGASNVWQGTAKLLVVPWLP